MRYTICLVFSLLLAVIPVRMQDADVPELTESYDGSRRLRDVSWNYPEGWHTLNGIPVNLSISFNIISSVPVGVRNQIEPGEEAIVMAFAGGRIDRWDNIEAGATPEDVLNGFVEKLGDGGPGDGPENAEDLEIDLEDVTFNGYEAIIMRFVAPDEAPNEASAEDDFNGDFVMTSILLDDNRFMVVIILTSELTFDDARPTVEAILGSLTYTP